MVDTGHGHRGHGYGGQCPLGMDIVVDNVAPDQGSGSRIRIKPCNLSRSFFFSSIFVYPLPSHATSPTHGSKTMSPFPVFH